MRTPPPFLFSLPLVLALLALPACGPNLVKTPAGWKAEGTTFTIAPGPDGGIMPKGWTLANYEPSGAGFRRLDMESKIEFELKRIEDDGLLLVITESVPDDALEKKPEVLAERWLTRVVLSPRGDDGTYDALVPLLKTETTLQIGLRFGSASTLHGRSADVKRVEALSVAGGVGVEEEVDLAPAGAPGPDRRLYLAILRAAVSPNMVVIAYANTPAMYPAGAADAIGLVHRIRF